MPSAKYPHVDLANTVKHLVENVLNKERDNDLNGITLECFACLAMTAALHESIVIFIVSVREFDGVGSKTKFWPKVNAIIAASGGAFSEDAEPMLSLKQLREFRNAIMHSKPEVSDDNAELTEDGYPKLDLSWAEGVDPTMCQHMFNHVCVFRNKLFNIFEINPGEYMKFSVASVSTLDPGRCPAPVDPSRARVARIKPIKN